MTLLEQEFVCLCRDYFDEQKTERISQFSKEPDEISQFLSKLLQKHQKIQITDEVRYYIPLLAQYKDGVLCPILETCVEGISPLHFVPELSLEVITKHDDQNPSIKAKESVAPRRYKNLKNSIPSTSRTFSKEDGGCAHTFRKIEDIGELPKITLPQTARLSTGHRSSRVLTSTFRRQPLPPLKDTQDSVLPTLFIKDNQNFYMAKKVDQNGLDFSILPVDYPDHLIADDFAVLSSNGVIMMNGERSSVVDLDQFVEDIGNEYIVERSSFRLRYSYRFFYTWRERYRNRLFGKIIRGFDKKAAVCNVGFAQFINKVREDVLTTTDPLLQIYPRSFDIVSQSGDRLKGENGENESVQSSSNVGDNTAEFSELIDAAAESVEAIDKKVRLMGENTCRQIAEVFKQVRSANLLMQLDFEELNSLNSLPPSLLPFKSDLKWRVPSLHRQRLCENVLRRERKLAGERQAYIRTFFNRIRSFYTGLLIVQCKQTLLNFLFRFSSRTAKTEETRKIRINKLVANFDEETGLSVYPSRSLFLNWIERTSSQIADAFISENKHINIDVISDIDPEYEFETENPKLILSRYSDLNAMKTDVADSINEVFDFVDHEIMPHSNFLRNLKSLSDEAVSFDTFRKCDTVQSMINNLINAKQSLSKRPKTIYHTLPENKETINFVVDLKPSFEEAGSILSSGTKAFQNNLVADLNNQFSEIQEKWACLKEKPISSTDCKELENKFVLFASLSDMSSEAWEEMKSEIQPLVDIIIGFYRALNDACIYTTMESMQFFNRTCQKMGISSVLIDVYKNKNQKVNDYEYEYEYEEEEDKKEK